MNTARSTTGHPQTVIGEELEIAGAERGKARAGERSALVLNQRCAAAEHEGESYGVHPSATMLAPPLGMCPAVVIINLCLHIARDRGTALAGYCSTEPPGSGPWSLSPGTADGPCIACWFVDKGEDYCDRTLRLLFRAHAPWQEVGRDSF